MKALLSSLFILSVTSFVVSCNSEDSPWYESTSLIDSNQREDVMLIDPNSTELTSEDAIRVSNLFMERENISPTSSFVSSSRNSSGILPIKSPDGNIVAYVVNYSLTGFSIISATKKYSPILAFSDKGCITQSTIDNNSGLSWWVQCISNDILKAESEIKENTPEYAMVRSEWLDYEKRDTEYMTATTTGNGYYWFVQLRDQMMSTVGMAEVRRNDFYYTASTYGVYYNSSNEEAYFSEMDRSLSNSYANNPPVPPSFVWGEGNLGSPSVIKIEPLLDTYWDQGYPYNLLLPLQNGSLTEHCPSGCVTIATSQIMNYHSYPNTVDGTTIDWGQTQKRFASADDIEIQRLIKVVNVGVETTSDGASNINKAQRFLQRNDYQANIYDSDIETVLVNEIKSNRPVYMRGDDNQVGHAWVCDGYYTKNQRRQIIAYSISSTQNINFSSSPYHVYMSNTKTVNQGKFYHMNWGWGYGYMDESDPSQLNNNSVGWYRSVFDVDRFNNSMKVMQVIPNK